MRPGVLPADGDLPRPHPERPALTARDHAMAVGFGAWMIVGLFLDGWAHDNNEPESFFTPWHGILYSGFAAAAAAAIWIVVRARPPGGRLVDAVPRGHGTTLVALAVFGSAAAGDLVWHELLGVEVGVEALLSPTHLALMASGLVALTAPLRRAWTSADVSPPTLRSFVPTVLSAAFGVAVVGFFLAYLSPFINDAGGTTFTRAASVPHDHPPTDPAELAQLLEVASILVTTVLFAVAASAIRRRWIVPPGSFTILFGVTTMLFVGLGEFRHAPVILVGAAAGAVADVLRERPAWLLAAAATTTLWLGYFAVYWMMETRVAWTAELWTGTVTLSALLAGLIGAAVDAPVPAREVRAAGALPPERAPVPERRVAPPLAPSR